MDFSHRDIAEILKIVDASGFTHVVIEDGSFRLSVSRDVGAATNFGESACTSLAAAQPDQAQARNPLADEALPVGESSTPVGTSRRVNIGGVERQVMQMRPAIDVSPAAVPVEAPMLGVFYRAPAPDAPPFVEVGQRVATGDMLCLVEAMKMFMPVHSPVDGTVAAIGAQNGALVEFGQPVVWIEAAAA